MIRCKLCITLHANHKWTATPKKCKAHNITKYNFSSQHALQYLHSWVQFCITQPYLHVQWMSIKNVENICHFGIFLHSLAGRCKTSLSVAIVCHMTSFTACWLTYTGNMIQCDIGYDPLFRVISIAAMKQHIIYIARFRSFIAALL